MNPYRFINWSETTAYAGAPTEYGIFLNLKGREPFGEVDQTQYESLRDEIIEQMREATYDRTGAKIFTNVYKREEVYNGTHVETAPDIVFELASGFYISELTAPNQDRVFSEIENKTWGFHEPDGIFMIHSKGAKQGRSDHLQSVENVTPMILRLLQIPQIENLDGAVDSNELNSSWLQDNPVLEDRRVSYKSHSSDVEYDDVYSSEEEALISQRLKDLGY